MKGLNKLVLASAIAAISAGAQAELKALDDSAMGELTGQAGLTIDIETQYTIGEFAYKDGGSVLFQGISMGGSTSTSNINGGVGGMLDNIRLNLDVANAGENLHYGFSEITELAGLLVTDYANGDTSIGAIAAGKANLNDKIVANDGDLVIHIDATDHLERMGGFAAIEPALGGVTFAQVVPAVHAAVDFGYSIDAIKLASSDYVIGSGANGADAFTGTGVSTTLISDLSINGYLGPVDIRIENNGNGFDGTGANGAASGNADSKIHWDTYVDVTDLDVYIDIAGVKIEDMKINNTRGDTTNIDGNESFAFAHSKRDIYAVKDAVLALKPAGTPVAGTNVANWVDGIAINTQFKGDMEIGALSFGDTGESIGELYFTDITSTTNWVISAH